MKKVRTLFLMLLINVLLLGLSHPVLAEDSFDSNPNNGEGTQSTENQIEEPKQIHLNAKKFQILLILQIELISGSSV